MNSQQLTSAMTDSERASERSSQTLPMRAGGDPGVVMDCRIKTLHYGDFLAVRDTNIPIVPHEITSFIGPSGCGKSTVLRSLNRMNDFVTGFRFTGSVHYRGQDIYAPEIDPASFRAALAVDTIRTTDLDNPYFGVTVYLACGDLFAGHLLQHHARLHSFPLGLQDGLRVDSAEQVKERSDQTCPPGLVAGAQASSVVAVEVLVEKYQVTPMRIVLELGRASIDRSLSLVVP